MTSTEDNRPQNQLSTAHKQHEQGLCTIVEEASATLHTILLGMGSTIYNTHGLSENWA
jgi:hypothetical protein